MDEQPFVQNALGISTALSVKYPEQLGRSPRRNRGRFAGYYERAARKVQLEPG